MPRVERDDTIPESLMLTLQRKIPGFKNEAPQHQWALTKMVWHGNAKTRRHSHFDEAMSFTYQELAEAFGRKGFKEVNERLGFFKVTDHWSKDNHTKGYWLSDKVHAVWESYTEKIRKSTTRLLLKNGKELKTLPAAIASKDKTGATTTQWKAAKDSKLNNVRVDMESLKRLRTWLQSIKTQYKNGIPPHDLVTEYPDPAVINRLLEWSGQLIRLGNTKAAGYGYIPHTYEQAHSGRIYGNNVNLQNAPSLIKEAALHGLWEYDIENCHFVILEQMAASHGYQCQAIADYLANKDKTRQAIARQAEISIDEAKTCLLAIMYGARRSEWHENAIPNEIGKEGARRLYQVPLFNGIADDVDKARAAILKGHKRTRNLLVNAFSKGIKDTEPPKKILAHLIQGVEALALKTVIDLYPQDIVLLQHDGWASNKRLHDKVIIDALSKVTGYQFKLKETEIKIDPDAYFLRCLKTKIPK